MTERSNDLPATPPAPAGRSTSAGIPTNRPASAAVGVPAGVQAGVQTSAPAGAAAGTDEPTQLQVREGLLEVPGELSLHHGGRLATVRVAWRLAGPAGAPVVVALGGISAHLAYPAPVTRRLLRPDQSLFTDRDAQSALDQRQGGGNADNTATDNDDIDLGRKRLRRDDSIGKNSGHDTLLHQI